jgi:hypothetical protein
MFFDKSRIAASAGSNPPTPSTALEGDVPRVVEIEMVLKFHLSGFES